MVKNRLGQVKCPLRCLSTPTFGTPAFVVGSLNINQQEIDIDMLYILCPIISSRMVLLMTKLIEFFIIGKLYQLVPELQYCVSVIVFFRRDAWLIAIMNSATSVFAGIVVFSILGNLADGGDVRTVLKVKSGRVQVGVCHSLAQELLKSRLTYDSISPFVSCPI